MSLWDCVLCFGNIAWHVAWHNGYGIGLIIV